MSQSAVNLLRSQFQHVCQLWLEGTMTGVTSEQAHWRPSGLSAPISAQYVHAVLGLDFVFLGMACGQAPLATSTFGFKIGVSEPPPMGDWSEWADRVQVDLDAMRPYAQAVYAAIDNYLATLSDDDLARQVDLSAMGLGQQTIASTATLMIANTAAHTGEISVTKGLQGLKGYPF